VKSEEFATARGDGRTPDALIGIAKKEGVEVDEDVDIGEEAHDDEG
jgi:type III secretion system FlhB-like substrate exporter